MAGTPTGEPVEGDRDDSTNRLFNEIDLDGDGVITHEDLDRLEGVLPAPVSTALRSHLGPDLRTSSLPPQGVADLLASEQADDSRPFSARQQLSESMPATLLGGPHTVEGPRLSNIFPPTVPAEPPAPAATLPPTAGAAAASAAYAGAPVTLPPQAPASVPTVAQIPSESIQVPQSVPAVVTYSPRSFQSEPLRPSAVNPGTAPQFSSTLQSPPMYTSTVLYNAPATSPPAALAPPPAPPAPPVTLTGAMPAPPAPPAATTVTSAPAAAAGAARPTPEMIFAMLDKDNDGFITRAEFQAALAKFQSAQAAQPAVVEHAPVKVEMQVGEVLPGIDPTYEELFQYRDLDGELTGAGGEVFAQLDRNQDGVITREEFLLAFAGNRRIGLRGDEDGEYDAGAGFHLAGLGEYEEEFPDVDVNLSGLEGPDIDLHGLDVNLHGPNIHVKGPDINVDLKSWENDIHGPGIHGPHWHVGGPDVDFELGDLKVEEAPLGCFQKFLVNCEWCCDGCEQHCCVPFLYHCAVICGFNPLAMEKETTMERLSPWLFSFLCFMLFASPIWITYQMSQDMQVRYWISDQLSIVLLLPVLYLAVQWWHAKKGTLNRALVLLCLVGSCIFLLFLGDMVLLSSYQKSNALFANDCSTDMEKAKLQVQWQNAELFYTDCMAETADSTGSSLESAYGLYRIQDCAGYSDHLAMNPAWPYLGALEETYNCGGWCERSQPLWTFNSVKDSCATTVADILYNKVEWNMLQVLVYTVAVLVFLSVCLIQTGPILRSHGVAWK